MLSLVYKKNDIFPKKLVAGKKRISGRNSGGGIVVYNRGGSHKRKYRFVDFYRNIYNLFGVVQRIEYDPNRTALIALVIYTNGLCHYIIKSRGLTVGDIIYSSGFSKGRVSLSSFSSQSYTLLSTVRPLFFFPLGSILHNIEHFPWRGGVFCRSAGTSARLVSSTPVVAVIRLSSSVLLTLSANCSASLGVVSSATFTSQISYRKASYWRFKGWRPNVRGVAMNPIDHPHGGGEGKTSGGRPSVTPWGKITKGKPTRSLKKPKLVFSSF